MWQCKTSCWRFKMNKMGQASSQHTPDHIRAGYVHWNLHVVITSCLPALPLTSHLETSKPEMQETRNPTFDEPSSIQVGCGQVILFLMLMWKCKRSWLKFTGAFCEPGETQPIPQTRHLPKLPVSREHLFAVTVALQGVRDADYVSSEGVPQVCVCWLREGEGGTWMNTLSCLLFTKSQEGIAGTPFLLIGK